MAPEKAWEEHVVKMRRCARAIYRGILTIQALVLALIGFGCTRPGTPAGTAPFDYHAFVDALQAAGTTAALVEDGGASLLNRDVRVHQVELGGSGLGDGTRLDGVEIQVYEYPDLVSQEADAERISPSGSPIGDRMVTWVDQPNFWGRGRLIVLYVGREPAVIQLLDRVMGDPITHHR